MGTRLRRLDAVLFGQEILKGCRQNLSQFLPCQDSERRTQFDESDAAHDCIPGFEKIWAADVEQDAERTMECVRG